jgi:hypothetical protein
MQFNDTFVYLGVGGGYGAGASFGGGFGGGLPGVCPISGAPIGRFIQVYLITSLQ